MTLTEVRGLGPDELTLLRLIAGGRSPAAAATEMVLTTPQVYEMLRHIRRGLGVATTVEAVVLAVRRRLI